MLIYEIPFSGKWISTKTTVHYIKKDSRYFTFIYFSLLHQEVIDKDIFFVQKYESNDFYKGCGFYIKVKKA